MSGAPHSKNRLGFCETCSLVLPVESIRRDNRLYLARDCPQCGHSETLISHDAAAYYQKQELVGYAGNEAKGCSLDCLNCRHTTSPALVIVDVTNRCNMNCPICLANIPAMGFEFNPPLEYFDKIFAHVAQLSPKPRIQLFGGEPTCRDDLLDILRLVRKHGLHPRIVTNGLRLADEDYCRDLLRISRHLLFSLDGLDEAVHTRLRKDPSALNKKLKALENIEKHTGAQVGIVCTTASDVSESAIPDLLRFCYDKRHLVERLMLITYQGGVGPENLNLDSSTVEDVEHLMERSCPGLEFVPVAALRRMKNLNRIFDMDMTLGGAHPNCKCLALMVADPQAGEYRPISEYLKMPLKQFVRELLAWDQQIGPKVERGILGRLFGSRGERAHLRMALARWGLGRIKIRKALGPGFFRALLRAFWGVAARRKSLGHFFRQWLGDRRILQIVILPSGRPGAAENCRLNDCPIVFACEHPDTAEVTLIPFCSYFVFKNDILRKTAERWNKSCVATDPPRDCRAPEDCFAHISQ